MGKYQFKSKWQVIQVDKDTKDWSWFLKKKELDEFCPDVLGLGNTKLPSKRIEAIASIFDLSGFTKFCSQVDPHLAIPEYLSKFLDWLFTQVRHEVTSKTLDNGVIVYADFPFLAKFLGDGVLFLWDTQNMEQTEMCNVIGTLRTICENYAKKFLPEIEKVVSDPPDTLRCGVARGMVCSVGDEEDYVGPCINIASRLQKMSRLTFCFAARGFHVDKMHESYSKQFIMKKVSLRGIGENERVWVLHKEFNDLDKQEKALFREP